MTQINHLVDALQGSAQAQLASKLGGVSSPLSGVYGTWLSAEAVDANLSQVALTNNPDPARWVPKGAHVTGLVAGDTILMIHGGNIPLTILMKVVGNITLALEP